MKDNKKSTPDIRAALKITFESVIHSILGITKTAIIRVAVFGLLPASVSERLIRTGELIHA